MFAGSKVREEPGGNHRQVTSSELHAPSATAATGRRGARREAGLCLRYTVNQTELVATGLTHWVWGASSCDSYLTAERLLSRMLQRVDFQRHAALEGLPTGLTGEGHVLGVSCRYRGAGGRDNNDHNHGKEIGLISFLISTDVNSRS